jgi:hypothetical protein
MDRGSCAATCAAVCSTHHGFFARRGVARRGRTVERGGAAPRPTPRGAKISNRTVARLPAGRMRARDEKSSRSENRHRGRTRTQKACGSRQTSNESSKTDERKSEIENVV